VVIRELRVEGYGKISNLYLQFCDGFNMIYGLNESGKTTLLKCMESLIYGEISSGGNNQEEKESLRPWDGSPYRASMLCMMEDGGLYKVLRDFDGETLKILDAASGEDITDTYKKEHGKTPNLATKYPVLEKNRHLCAIFTHEDKMSEPGDIRKLSSGTLSGSGMEAGDSTYSDSIIELEKARNEIDSMSAPNTPEDGTKAIAAGGERSSKEQVEDQEEVEKLEIERLELKSKFESTDHEMKELIFILQRLKAARCQSIIEQVESVDKEIEQLQLKIGKVGDQKAISLEGSNTLYSLELALKSAKEKMARMDIKRDEMRSDYKEVREKLQEKGPLLKVDHDILERLNISEVPEERRSALIETKQKMLEDSIQKMEGIKEKYQEEASKFSSFKDAGEYDETISDLEVKIARKDILKLKESEFERLNKELIKLKARIRSRILTSILVMLFGGFFWAYIYNKGIFSGGLFVINSDRIVFGVGTALFVFGIVYWLTSGALRKEEKITLENIGQREREIKAIKDDVSSSQIRLRELFTVVGVLSTDDLRKKYREFNRIKIDMETTANLVKTLEKELKSLAGDFEESPVLKRVMIDLKYITSDGKLDEETVIRFKKDYHEAREIENKSHLMRNEYEEFVKERKELEEKINEIEEEMKEILGPAAVDSIKEYNELLETTREMDKLKSTLESLGEKRGILLGNKTPGDYLNKLDKLKRSISLMENEKPEFAGIDMGKSDPDSINEEIERLSPIRMDMKSGISALDMRIRTLREKERHVFSPGEIDRLSVEKSKLEKHRESIEIAMEKMKEAAKKFNKELFTPKLSSSVADILRQITGKYDRFEIDDELNILVGSPDKSKLIPIERLGRGTIEQVYYALRLGIARTHSEEKTYPPIIMDQPFHHFDEVRRKRAIEDLVQSDSKHQVILLTGSRKQRSELAQVLKEKKRKAKLVNLGNLELIKVEPV